MSGLFKGLAQSVESAVSFQILALLIAFIFFVVMAVRVLKRPKGYYESISEYPLKDQMEEDKIISNE